MKQEVKMITKVLTILLGLFLIAIVLYISSESKPEFKITQENCWNETESYFKMIVYDMSCFVDTEKVVERLQIKYLYLNCDSKKTDECLDLKKNIENIKEDTNQECLDFIEEERKRKEEEKKKHTKEVCEQVEVDEIEYREISPSKARKCSIPIPNSTLMMVLSFESDKEIEKVSLGNLIIYPKRCKDEDVYPIKTISKQNLTIEWLNENCGFKMDCSRCYKRLGKPDRYDCFVDEYKCGKYTIKIK